jgi:hypothetical protein
MRGAQLVVCILCLSSCSEPRPVPTGPVDATVVLAPGAAADVRDAGIQVRFVDVAGDSRCPGDAICIHAGDAIVRIEVVPDIGSSASYQLHTAGPRIIQFDDVRVELVSLAPYPFTTRPIDARDYRATIRVTR